MLVQVSGRMRLTALAAVLRSQGGLDKGPEGAKGVVFLSSCAGVDFHYAVLGQVYEGIMEEPLLPCPLFRLHGNLAQVASPLAWLYDGNAQLAWLYETMRDAQNRLL